MRLFKLALTIALAMFLIDGTTAMADKHVFEQDVADGSGNYLWQTAANWDLGSVPSAGDEAEIPTGLRAVVQGTADICGFVDIHTNGVVVIDGTSAAAKLTFDGNGAAQASTLATGATLSLEGSSAELAVIDDNHTVSGLGAIDGQDNSAVISIASGITLTSSTTIQGHLEIQDATSSGSFLNQGKVYADDPSGTLTISVTSVDDTDNGGTVSSTNFRWGVNASGAVLLFSVQPASMVGDFYLHQGTVQLGTDPGGGGDDIDVCSTGDILFDGGSITAGVADSFTCSGTCP